MTTAHILYVPNDNILDDNQTDMYVPYHNIPDDYPLDNILDDNPTDTVRPT